MLEALKSADHRLFFALNGFHSSVTDQFFFLVSEKWIWIPFYILLAVLIYRKRKSEFLLVLVAVALMITISDQLASGIIKPLVMRLRPCQNPEFSSYVHLVNGYCGGKYGFVSSHAANVFAMAVFISSLMQTRWLTVVLFAWATIVASSRVFIGVHYPADVIGGMLVGVFAAMLVLYLFRLYSKKKQKT